MPTNAILTVRPNTLVEGVCFQSDQERLNAFARNLIVTLPGTYNTFNYGSSTPAVEDRDKPWFRTTDVRWYDWSSLYGKWVSRHPDFTGKVILYEGDISGIATLDGGSAGTVTAVTGPMWEEVTEARARFPLHPGTLESLTVVARGDTGGAEKHELTLAELPEFTVPRQQPPDTGGPYLEHDASNEGDSGVNKDVADNTPIGSGAAHNNMPPYYGIYLLRKTARTFYTV